MDSDPSDLEGTLYAEFVRLGLDPHRCPAAGVNVDALPGILDRIRRLDHPATWRDVFPDFPREWDPEDPDTWRMPYAPRGPHDYPEYPTGPVVLLYMPFDANETLLESVMRKARADGQPVYGYVLRDSANPELPTKLAEVVLARGTSEEQLGDFTEWVEQQPNIEVAGIPRLGNEGPMEPRSYHAT